MLRPLICILILAVPTITAAEHVTCKTSGKFLDYTSPDCRGYIMCVATAVPGVYNAYSLNCPVGFTFNPEENLCTNSTNFYCLARMPEFECSTVGRFHNPNDAGCDTYIECFVQYDGNLKSRILKCPDGLNFDPVMRGCVAPALYKCIQNTTPKPPHKSSASKMQVASFITLLCSLLFIHV